MGNKMFRESWWLPGLHRDEDDYYRFDGDMTGEQFAEASGHLGRNESPALLYDLWSVGSISVYEHPEVVSEAWSGAEFPVDLLPFNQWVELFGEAGYTHDGEPAPRPEQAVTVYRGCHHERRFGMSWTTDIERARWFADRDLGQGVGLIYVFNAPPEALLAYIHESSRGEAEYVINPEYLNDRNVTHIHA
jgi:hypothetical protein